MTQASFWKCDKCRIYWGLPLSKVKAIETGESRCPRCKGKSYGETLLIRKEARNEHRIGS